MKKFLKISVASILILLILFGLFITYFSIITSKYKLNANNIVSVETGFTLYDINDNKTDTLSVDHSVVSFEELQDYTVNAFVSIEDKRFFKHKGIDYTGLLRATLKNISTLSFKEGGSTITQQLIKNTHLSSEKTLKRKLIEIKLAKELERKFTKEEILEKYLNTIYFGKNVYGIENASRFYFDKNASDLTISESATLAGIIKAPNTYSPIDNLEKCTTRRNTVLKCMKEQNYITEQDYNLAVSDKIEIKQGNYYGNSYSYTSLCLTELDKILKENPYEFSNCKIYTYYDTDLSDKVFDIISSNDIYCDKSIVLTDKNSNILAYHSSCNELLRQPGSLLKPFISYAPCIEKNIIDSASYILDEETSFDGYSPKNYNNKYYGYVSAKEALAKSLNTPAVKLLNSFGIDNAVYYLSKMNISFDEDELGLGLSLGGMKNGLTLKHITSLYSVFLNNGEYYSPKTIRKIEDKNGRIIYKANNYFEKVFSDDTAYILSDMLSETVISGTAKRLKNDKITLYAKTGTVGNESGNKDAYCVSFTKDFILGTWMGNANYSLMDNKITGGTHPAILSSEIWNTLYEKNTDTKIPMPTSVEYQYIDKSEYLDNMKIILADPLSPDSEKISTIFKKSNLPTQRSEKFSQPNIKDINIKLNDENVLIEYTTDKYIELKIFRESDNDKIEVFDSKNSKGYAFIDDKTKGNAIYTYTALPYYDYSDEIILGEEIIIGTVKIPPCPLPDDWWLTD